MVGFTAKKKGEGSGQSGDDSGQTMPKIEGKTLFIPLTSSVSTKHDM